MNVTRATVRLTEGSFFFFFLLGSEKLAIWIKKGQLTADYEKLATWRNPGESKEARGISWESWNRIDVLSAESEFAWLVCNWSLEVWLSSK